MTRVLTVLMDHPIPATTGFHHRMLSGLEMVKRSGCESHVAWFSTSDRPITQYGEDRFTALCAGTHYLGPRREQNAITAIRRVRYKVNYGTRGLLRRPSSTYPYSLRYDIADGERKIAALAVSLQADIVILPVQFAHWQRSLGGPRVIIDAGDILSSLTKNIRANSSGLAHQVSLFLNERACTSQETIFLPNADEVWTTSDDEAKFLNNERSCTSAYAIPNVIATTSLQAHAEIPNTIAFLGTYSYQPNLDAARELINEVLPLVRRDVPDAKLMLAGSGWPENETLPEHVSHAGAVDDASEFLQSASVIALPIRTRGGVPLKLIESMQLGKAIVATPQLINGTDVTAGTDVLCGQSANDIAQAIIRLLRSPELRAQLGQQARDSHNNHFSLQSAMAILQKRSVLCQA